MTTTQATKTYEMFQLYQTGYYVVRCVETGTETIALKKGRAAKILRALQKGG